MRRNAWMTSQEPDPGRPPGPRTDPKEARRPREPQAHQKPKQAKNAKKHPKHQKTPRVAALGFASATREREGEPKQRANKIMFPSLDRPLAVCVV